MKTEEILTLINAGFTKEDILLLVGAEKGNEPKPKDEKGAQIIPNEPKAEEPKAEPKPEEQKANAPIMSDAQVKQLAQALNIGNASIDVPPTVTIDSKMEEHFKNLLLGKE